ncbi:hypothetical protein Acife_1917 [Acidithiobacillus ferrivorans SS3]|uniref:Uncharacterized protein n=1 Tax=Acidithiobacillus ferrivorans SS3 TaxID=743299 RepID=G0JLJ1_9PROT|nr:hypothetical protein [Acidithiobacillus ferrivorans]AEM48040.1 hypothetical protein Acife_1917 [Acidithiobacillus ferrivorans SS3]
MKMETDIHNQSGSALTGMTLSLLIGGLLSALVLHGSIFPQVREQVSHIRTQEKYSQLAMVSMSQSKLGAIIRKCERGALDVKDCKNAEYVARDVDGDYGVPRV